MQVNFGSGNLILTRTDISPATPRPLGIVQDVQIDASFSVKKLYGQNQIAVDVARGALDIKGAIKFSRIQGALLNDLFFAQTDTASTGIVYQSNESHSIPTTPYQVTVTNSATFVADMGVFYAATSIQLTHVASGPTTGQYSYAAGVYTFAAADTGLSVYIGYTNTVASGVNQISLSQQLMGSGPRFNMLLASTYLSKVCNIVFNQITSSKLSLPFKNQDYVNLSLDIEVMQDASNNIGTVTLTE